MGVYPVPYPAQLFTVLPHREHYCSNIIVVFFRLAPSQSVDATKPLVRLHNQRKVIPTDPANCFNARRTLKGAVYTSIIYAKIPRFVNKELAPSGVFYISYKNKI